MFVRALHCLPGRFGGLALFCSLIVVGCSSVLDVSSYHLSQPYRDSVVDGVGFMHAVVLKERASGDVDPDTLHVYIEGDGRPWVTRISKATDPTPARATVLELMALDAAAAIYLGRPCYFVKGDSACDNAMWWTSHRYSAEVVQSMNAVLDQYAAQYQKIVLIGHSGGGTLAYLLAAQRDDVELLVTLAGNLNTALWTAQHRVTPLVGSMNPARQPPLDPRVRQMHFLGSEDGRISREVVASVVARQAQAQFTILDGVDHNCCWLQVWPEILEQL